MNVLHAFPTRSVNRGGNGTFGLGFPAAQLSLAASALIALHVDTATGSLRLGQRFFSALLPSIANNHLGTCVHCGAPVTDGDPFIRYRGEYYHAHACAESNPPALSRRQVPAA
jgi:hypothetical protein